MAIKRGTNRILWVIEVRQHRRKTWQPTTPAYHRRKEALPECGSWEDPIGKIKFRVTAYVPRKN